MEDLKWYIKDESTDREGFICLAIREESSDRLVADLADHPNDIPFFVERAKEEANLIAHAKELRDVLERLVDALPKRNGTRIRDTMREAFDLLAKVKGESPTSAPFG